MKNHFKVTKPFLIRASVILVLALVVGTIHGFYSTMQKVEKHQYHAGGDFCQGEYESGIIHTSELGETIMVNFKLSVNTGQVTFTLLDPTGEVVYERSDEKPVFRQYSVQVKEKSQIGNWEYRINCEKADMLYELSIDIENAS